MSFINKLARKYKKYEITNFWRVIVSVVVIGAILGYITPQGFYSEYLSLNPALILKGQIWRIVTFLFQPRGSILYVLLEVYFYYWLGATLENMWGAFKFNLFYYIGVLSTVLVSILMYVIFGLNFSLSITYLSMVMFLSFVALFPEQRVLFMFIIPIKTKWIGVFDAVILGWTIIKGFMPVSIMTVLPESIYVSYLKSVYLNNAISASIAAVIFVIFSIDQLKIMRNKNYRRVKIKVKNKQKNDFEVVNEPHTHKCEVCGRTNLTNPELEFRYCSKCNGLHEYCIDHIYTHVHK